MMRVAVRIFHPQPAADPGQLSRWLHSARSRLAERHRRGFEAAGAASVHIVSGPADDLPFGRRLRDLAPELTGFDGVVLLGSGAIPLATAADRRRFVVAASGAPGAALANNRYSADVIAIAGPRILTSIPDIATDNTVPRWLEESAGYRVSDLRALWRLEMDIDSPLDVLLAERATDGTSGAEAGDDAERGIDGRPGSAIDGDRDLEADRDLDRDLAPVRARLAGVAAVAADPRAELVVTGRTSSVTLRWLEAHAAARVRAVIEERGLRAGTPDGRPPASVLGALLDRAGPAALGRILATLGEAAVVDTRVLLAHRLGRDERAWPDPEDRFASDLLLPDRIADPWLRDLTSAALDAPIPVLLGGHTLVGPGLRLVVGLRSSQGRQPSRRRSSPAASQHRVVDPYLGLRRPGDLQPQPVPESQPALAARIAVEIDARGPMTFARFMELALYDPDFGYYTGEAARPGRAGDFITAPEAHPIFGWTLARQVHQLWELLGRPAPFVIREHGAGTGALIAAILDGLAREAPALLPALRYQPVEVEPRRVAALRDRLAAAGRESCLDLNGAAAAPITGLVLGNEVLDALPVHRVRGLAPVGDAAGGGAAARGRAGRPGQGAMPLAANDAPTTTPGIEELLVTHRDGAFEELAGPPSTPALAERLAAEGITLRPGQQAEICLALDGWIAARAAELERGLVLLVDYGHPADQLYDGFKRPRGTLLAYQHHRAVDNPFQSVGRQDLTAHVDVTAVERAANGAGLATIGITTQAELLVSLGAGDLLTWLRDRPGTTIETYTEARMALVRMLDPAVMGRFRVMAFGRALPLEAHLKGLEFRLPPR